MATARANRLPATPATRDARTMDVNLTLTADDLVEILEALDSYEYWELGRDLPRNNGSVFIPGDYLGVADPYWSTEPTDVEAVAIEAVRAIRRLAGRLQDPLSDRSDDAGSTHTSAV